MQWFAAAAGLQPPVADKLIPVFTPEELSRLEQACAGRSFIRRRDTAIIAVLTATGIRLSELADLRCDDIDLWQRELTVRGKGGKDQIVKIGHQAARSLDRYPRAAPATPRPGGPCCGWEQATGTADRRHLPDDRPPRPPVRHGRLPAVVAPTTAS